MQVSCSMRLKAVCLRLLNLASGEAGFVAIPPLLTQVVERIETLYSRDNDSDVRVLRPVSPIWTA